MFQMRNRGSSEFESLPNFLIPLVNKSYHGSQTGFIGIQMTTILVQEIARLVTEHQESVNDIGLLAEQSESGDYYLRIFPNKPDGHSIAFPK